MVRRLVRTAGRLGVGADGAGLMRRAFELAMTPRLDRDLDDHHPDYLHTARTALILMDDARVAHAPTLGAALVVETRDEALVVPAEALRVELGTEVAELVAEVPVPDRVGGGLLEALVTASAPALRIAVAERLDHARHLHLRDRSEWAPYHATTCDVYAPAAARADAALAGRIEWWCATFLGRFLEDA